MLAATQISYPDPDGKPIIDISKIMPYTEYATILTTDGNHIQTFVWYKKQFWVSGVIKTQHPIKILAPNDHDYSQMNPDIPRRAVFITSSTLEKLTDYPKVLRALCIGPDDTLYPLYIQDTQSHQFFEYPQEELTLPNMADSAMPDAASTLDEAALNQEMYAFKTVDPVYKPFTQEGQRPPLYPPLAMAEWCYRHPDEFLASSSCSDKRFHTTYSEEDKNQIKKLISQQLREFCSGTLGAL